MLALELHASDKDAKVDDVWVAMGEWLKRVSSTEEECARTILEKLLADIGDGGRLDRLLSSVTPEVRRDPVCVLLSACARLIPAQTAVDPRKGADARGMWEHTVATYANLCRLHRLVACHDGRLPPQAQYIVREVHRWLGDVDNGGAAFLVHVPRLLPAIVQHAAKSSRDFAYVWYKVWGMCSHTPTTIVPMYAGYVGAVQPPTNHDGSSLELTIKLLCDTANDFVTEACTLLGAGQPGEPTQDELIRRIKRLPAKRSSRLRTLDCICFISTSCLVAARSLITAASIHRVRKSRTEVRDCVCRLSKCGVLFAADSEPPHLGWKCMVDRRFWTYEQSEPSTWDIHLFAGLLMLFWDL